MKPIIQITNTEWRTGKMKANMTLEEIVDKAGLKGTLEMLAAICYEKASHVDTNWQDHELARTWEKDAIKIDRLSTKIINN
jgi:hypothetical protein